MAARRGIYRPSLNDIRELERLRELVREAIGILKRCPKPDTFLGRKTYEPFPNGTAKAWPTAPIPARPEQPAAVNRPRRC